MMLTMKLTDTSNTPLYAKIETALAAEISSGKLVAGAQLPTEEQLIARFQMSRTTIRKAIDNLVARGLVEIRRGKGTFDTPQDHASPDRTNRLCRRHGDIGSSPNLAP